MMRRAFFLSVLFLAAACHEDDGATARQPDAGPELDSGAPDSGMADAGDDAGEPACEVGASTTGSFGPSGGSVSLCGASVSFAEGVLAEERSVTLSIVAVPEAPPFPLEAAGLAFNIAVEGGVPTDTPDGPLSVLVPTLETTRYRYFFRHDPTDGWQGFEACTVEPMAIGKNVYLDGTFVALVDTEDFPENLDSLGSGAMESTFDGAVTMFDLAGEEFNTYAIYNQNQDGSRAFQLAATKPETAESFLYLLVKFDVDKDGVPNLIEVTYGVVGGGGLWSFNPFQGTTPTITLTTDDGAHVAGSFAVEMQQITTEGTLTEMLSVSFDATAEKFRYPPELECGIPEG
jgi:hypothetical protein